MSRDPDRIPLSDEERVTVTADRTEHQPIRARREHVLLWLATTGAGMLAGLFDPAGAVFNLNL